MRKLFGVAASVWRWLSGGVEIVSVNDRPELLDAAYEIYKGRFAPTEIETQAVLAGYLATGWWKMYAAIRRGKVVGAIHLNFLVCRPKTAVVEHIYVTRELECRGIGSALYSYVEREVFPRAEIELVFLEMEDPGVMTPDEIADVESIGVSLPRRVKFWKMRGFGKADAEYLQGILEGAEDGCYNLALLMKWTDANKPWRIDVEPYLEINRAFAATYLSHEPEVDPFYCRIVAALRARSNGQSIEIIDAERNRSFHKC